jgi:hypothetical protein
VSDLVTSYRDRYGEPCWRDAFWRAQLRIAAARYRHPRFYGLSPCDADPARLVGPAQPPADPLVLAVSLATAA